MADLDQHAARIAELMQQLESGADPQTRERVFELLEHIDHLHRTCVWRLFELVTELGGNIIVPPFDTPVGRIAVAQDPQGAVFSLFQARPPA